MSASSKTVTLEGGGTITLEIDVDIFRTPREIRDGLFELIEALDALAAPAESVVTPPPPPALSPPTAPAAAAKSPPKAKPEGPRHGKRDCVECGKLFTPARADSRFCTGAKGACAKAYSNRRTNEKAKAKSALSKLTVVPPPTETPTPPERPAMRDTQPCMDCGTRYRPAHSSQRRCTACARSPEAS